MNAAPMGLGKTSEFDLQRFVVQALQLAGSRGMIWFHVPNGEVRSKRTGARLKAMGVRPGVADICIVLPGGRAAFLELKSPSGRTSPEQRIFRSDCECAGARYAVASSVDEAVAYLLDWGALRVDPLRRPA